MGNPEIRALAEAIYAELLGESVLTTTIEAHRETKRGQVVCGICGTRCRSHAPIQPHTSRASSTGPSREASPALKPTTTRPAGYTVGPEKGTGGGTGIGSGSGKVDSSGNAFFECLVCGRSITSARYAPHLAGCLGLSGGSRRGASRMAAAKARLGAHDRASPSPYLASENDSDAESLSGRRKKLLNGNGKRANSPSAAALAKKAKFAHTSGSAPPSSGRTAPHPPSRLGRPPISKAHSASPFSPDKRSERERDRGERADRADRVERDRGDRTERAGYTRESSVTSIGRKTLPGGGTPSATGSVRASSGGVEPAPPPPPAPPASPPPPPPPGGDDESSEGDDDY